MAMAQTKLVAMGGGAGQIYKFGIQLRIKYKNVLVCFSLFLGSQI